MACTVWGEPLCQTAQSFMPELMYGVNKSLAKVNVTHSQYYKSFAIYVFKISLFCSIDFHFKYRMRIVIFGLEE
jgi:hypothetical protein